MCDALHRSVQAQRHTSPPQLPVHLPLLTGVPRVPSFTRGPAPAPSPKVCGGRWPMPIATVQIHCPDVGHSHSALFHFTEQKLSWGFPHSTCGTSAPVSSHFLTILQLLVGPGRGNSFSTAQVSLGQKPHVKSHPAGCSGGTEGREHSRGQLEQGHRFNSSASAGWVMVARNRSKAKCTVRRGSWALLEFQRHVSEAIKEVGAKWSSSLWKAGGYAEARHRARVRATGERWHFSKLRM